VTRTRRWKAASGYAVFDEKGRLVAQCARSEHDPDDPDSEPDGMPSWEEAAENALLIAEAPDLLELAERLSDFGKDECLGLDHNTQECFSEFEKVGMCDCDCPPCHGATALAIIAKINRERKPWTVKVDDREREEE